MPGAQTTTTAGYTVRKPRARRGSGASARPSGGRRPSSAKLPGWGQLATPAAGTPQRSGFFEGVSTGRFALLILAIAAAFTLYVGHVHATQDLLAEVQQLRKDNMRLHMKYNRLNGEFDRRVGPAVIHERARALGLEEDIRYGPTIEVE